MSTKIIKKIVDTIHSVSLNIKAYNKSASGTVSTYDAYHYDDVSLAKS